MTRYLPIALGVLLIVGLTIPQIQMTDRFAGENFSAEQQAELLELVPKNIGNWRGDDIPVDEQVKKTAGAAGAISRRYRNIRTRDVVDLWLIVGHGRPVSRHTPNICYRTSGFEARAEEDSLYPMTYGDGQQEEAKFWTNTFFKEDYSGRSLIRVFWSWYDTKKSGEHDGKIVWEAPTNPRWYFGNTRALYKMYFTGEMRDPMETAEQSPCLQFAREFIPVVNKALSTVYSDAKKTGEVADDEGSDATADAEAETSEESQESTADESEEAAEEPTASADDSPGTTTKPTESAPVPDSASDDGAAADATQ